MVGDLVEVDDLLVTYLIGVILARRVKQEVERLEGVVVVLRQPLDLMRLEGREEPTDLKR